MALLSSSSAYRYTYSLWMFILSLDLTILIQSSCEDVKLEVDKHLEMSLSLIGQRQFQDALSHLHAAIDLDSKNYLSYYRRATVFLALGKSRLGLQDLESTLALKSDFLNARIQMASVLVKMGRLDEAYIQIENVLAKDSKNEEALRLFSAHEELTHMIQTARSHLNGGSFHEAIDVLKECIELAPWDATLREMRSEAYLSVGEVSSAISDLRSVTKLTQDNTEIYMRLSEIYYEIGDTELSLAEIRECLKLDPEHAKCFPFYKKVKKIAKLITEADKKLKSGDHDGCVKKANTLLKEESDEPQIQYLGYELLCNCEKSSPSSTIAACSSAIKINKEAKLFCDRAEAHILNSDYEEAIKDFKLAKEYGEHLRCAKEGLEKAQRLLKQASKKDYYKILGVKRTASKSDILKAYRKLAREWHPDHYSGEDAEYAKKRFLDIAAAKEVLTDPEKRQKFDQGEDPLDPEQQAGRGGFNPFQSHFFRGGFPGGGGGGFPFGDDGPFEFKFHFN